ncbi:MAG: ABC transporter ATP-binding protein [Alphaproteobacteria bacterium]|nr:ABC transporter ATP-binding protein [Alphaproteobacteria bacterium]
MVDAGPLAVAIRQAQPIPLDAAFTCAGHELLALVGPSGAGKTTILRAIAGLVRPREGRIAVAGETWYDAAQGVHVSPHRRAVGFVFQSYALFPHMTALGNVTAALGHLSASAREVEARDWLRRVHLEGLEDRRPAQLSGGQQQRVAMARALARRPRVLLLDEPFAAVDKVTRRKLYAELAELRGALDIPCVLVTHDLEEAGMLADRMAILRRGATIQLGTPDEITRRPASVDVARLIDMRNVFAGRVAGHDASAGVTRLDWAGTSLEAAQRPDLASGTAVAWCIPTSDIVLHRRDRPSRGERENPVHGIVAQALRLGDTTLIALRPDAAPTALVYVSIPTHVAMRNALTPGAAIGVSLLAAGIHLMPHDPAVG